LIAEKGSSGGGYQWGGGGPGGGSMSFTVSGKPCTRGHTCQLNAQAGFWSCPIDNTGKNWDYCCSPSHNCGYSEGMKMPWYVNFIINYMTIKVNLISLVL
jgi:hypothetical protein